MPLRPRQHPGRLPKPIPVPPIAPEAPSIPAPPPIVAPEPKAKKTKQDE